MIASLTECYMNTDESTVLGHADWSIKKGNSCFVETKSFDLAQTEHGNQGTVSSLSLIRLFVFLFFLRVFFSTDANLF